MKKSKKNKVSQNNKSEDWDFFDDCEMCQELKKAQQEGRKMSQNERESLFHHQNSKREQIVYIFEIRMLDNEKIMRAVAVPADFTLYELADTIINVYEFDFDHSFGFFSNINMDGSYSDSERSYELFTDLIEEGEDLEPTGAGSVKKTKISSVWGKPGEEMMFLFDYGEEWRFRVKLMALMLSKADAVPDLVESIGKAPKQYDAK